MSDYIICIPTYKRAEICKKRTLNTLQQNNIDPKIIYVYVADQEEYDIYKNTLDITSYNELIIGVKGLVSQRQFICNSWENNKYIVSLDDDIESIDLSLINENLDSFIRSAFDKCTKHKSYIWGVYPVYNLYWRKIRREMPTELTFICGAFYGYINRPTLEAIQPTLTNEHSGKEDVERTIKYFINDGIVLRFNKVGFKTKYYGAVGGLGNFKDRLIPMANACVLLKEKYGDYGKIKVRKNGMTEFVLKKI